MFMMMVYSYLMILLCFICFFGAMVFFYFSVDLTLEWLLYSVNSIMVEIFILFDWVSMLFMGFVLLISFMVMSFSISYMGGDKDLDRFVILVMLFVSSMLMMILSPSLISVLFGWDLLGLVSYCLVIYYQNHSAYNSGMVTVLTNRVGDVGLLMAIGVALSYGSWNLNVLKEEWILVCMILVAALTKSAQMPFSSWLPMAMAAPTPVSSLVHSSTLVTAGVYLIIRFNSFIVGTGINYILMFLAVITMVMSGLMANFECDFKKVIALSTLSQLGFMMMILSLGASLLGLFHLLIHAVFKSLLFMCAGCIIHVFKGNQDIRCYGNLSSVLPFLMISVFVSVLSLMGFPFMAGFYSKDFIVEVTYIREVNLILWTCIIASISLTVMYSLRLCFYLFFSSMKYSSLSVVAESDLMNLSMVMLMILSVSAGSLLNWGFYFDFGMTFLSDVLKSVVMTFFWLGVVLNVTLLTLGGSHLVKSWTLFFLSMWYLNFFHSGLSKYLVSLGGHICSVDQRWVEGGASFSFFKVKYFLMKTYYSTFKMYDVIINQILIFLILFVSLNFFIGG